MSSIKLTNLYLKMVVPWGIDRLGMTWRKGHIYHSTTSAALFDDISGEKSKKTLIIFSLLG